MFQLATFDYGKATVSVAPEVTFSVAGGLSCGAEQFYELPERFLEGLNGKIIYKGYSVQIFHCQL